MGPLVAGQETTLVVRLDWPKGLEPPRHPPEGFGLRGDDVPWRLVAVPVGTELTSTVLAGAEQLPLRRQGGAGDYREYTAAFRPATAGDWRLALAWVDESGALSEPMGIERVLHVDAAAPPVAAEVPLGRVPAAAVAAVAVAGLVLAGGALTRKLTRRSSAAPVVPQG